MRAGAVAATTRWRCRALGNAADHRLAPVSASVAGSPVGRRRRRPTGGLELLAVLGVGLVEPGVELLHVGEQRLTDGSMRSSTGFG